MIASLRRRLARRSLKPQLNQIRTWVRQGRTDAWIAHQLEVSVGDIRSFKREHELVPDEGGNGDEGVSVPSGDEELDLRAEDDARVAAALEAEQEDEEEEEEEERGRGGRRRRRRARAPTTTSPGDAVVDAAAGGAAGAPRARTSRERSITASEGYGLWLDPAIQDDAVYAEHWAGHRSVTVSVEPERIVIIRAGEGAGADEEDDD